MTVHKKHLACLPILLNAIAMWKIMPPRAENLEEV